MCAAEGGGDPATGANAMLELATTERDPQLVEYVVQVARLAADVQRGVSALVRRAEGTRAQELVGVLCSPEGLFVEVEVDEKRGGVEDERCALTGAFLGGGGGGGRRLRFGDRAFRVGFVGFQASLKILLFAHFLHSLVSFPHEDSTKAAKDYMDARTLVYGLEFAAAAAP